MQLSGAAGGALVNSLFTTAGRTRESSPALAIVAREALLGYASLSGEVFATPADRTAFQLQFMQQVRSVGLPATTRCDMCAIEHVCRRPCLAVLKPQTSVDCAL
eukprot:SAG31_NODE_2670_length_5271_cov_4.007541_6_plen_104_part_00